MSVRIDRTFLRFRPVEDRSNLRKSIGDWVSGSMVSSVTIPLRRGWLRWFAQIVALASEGARPRYRTGLWAKLGRKKRVNRPSDGGAKPRLTSVQYIPQPTIFRPIRFFENQQGCIRPRARRDGDAAAIFRPMSAQEQILHWRVVARNTISDIRPSWATAHQAATAIPCITPMRDRGRNLHDFDVSAHID